MANIAADPTTPSADTAPPAHQETPVMGHAFLILGIVALVMVGMRLRGSDADVCRRTFAGLVQGRQSVQGAIDWAHLHALRADVGDTYRQLRDDKQRADFRKTFILGFSEGFRVQGVGAGAFTNWRIQARTEEQVTVAADYPAQHKTLVFRLSLRDGKRIEDIQWQ